MFGDVYLAEIVDAHTHTHHKTCAHKNQYDVHNGSPSYLNEKIPENAHITINTMNPQSAHTLTPSLHM